MVPSISFVWLLTTLVVVVHGQTSPMGVYVERNLTTPDSTTRWFLERQPKSYQPSKPLVIVLHGATRSMRKDLITGTFAFTQLTALSDKEGFLILAPNGANIVEGDTTKGDNQFWNSLGEVDDTWTDMDDVTFLKSLVEWAIRERGVNSKRVYLVGYSNGGMMIYRALKETMPPTYAAAATFCSPMVVNDDIPPPNITTPLTLMMGTNDSPIWPGGLYKAAYNISTTVKSALSVRDYWITVNNADRNNLQQSKFPNNNWFDGCRIKSELYPAKKTTDGSLSSPLQFVTMEGGGHYVPYTGGNWRESYRTRGAICRDVDGFSVAWNFLSQHSL